MPNRDGGADLKSAEGKDINAAIEAMAASAVGAL